MEIWGVGTQPGGVLLCSVGAFTAVRETCAREDVEACPEYRVEYLTDLCSSLNRELEQRTHVEACGALMMTCFRATITKKPGR